MFSARLMFFANLSKICLIELTTRRGAQYCRSSGTIAKILKIDRKNDTSLIRLPSGRAKLFSMYAFASVGRVLFKENRNFLNSKAGY
jgi:ribosomal protein L2